MQLICHQVCLWIRKAGQVFTTTYIILIWNCTYINETSVFVLDHKSNKLVSNFWFHLFLLQQVWFNKQILMYINLYKSFQKIQNNPIQSCNAFFSENKVSSIFGSMYLFQFNSLYDLDDLILMLQYYYSHNKKSLWWNCNFFLESI